MKKGILVLIPVPLHEEDSYTLSEKDRSLVSELRHFIVENEKNARRFLRNYVPLAELNLYVLNEHTTPEEYYSYLDVCKKGLSMGLLSDCGCPAVADPGAQIVAMAHTLEIAVLPLVGPSSILLALMASGCNGQGFQFHGYIPIKEPDRSKKLKEIESKSRVENSTQIFIEAPYRNQQLFEALIKTLRPDTTLSISCQINTPKAFTKTLTIEKWRKKKPDIQKRVCIFLLQA